MTEQTKAVFANPQLLRQKLGEYLNTTDTIKIEKYAIIAEKMFNKGARQSLKFYIGWSWWAFFGQFWYCLYRGANKAGLKYAIFGLAPLIMCIPLCYLATLFGGGATDSDPANIMISVMFYPGIKIALAFLLIAMLVVAISQWACIFHSKCHIIKSFEKALDENVTLFGVGHKSWVIPVGIIYGILYPVFIFLIIGAIGWSTEIGAKQYMNNSLTESNIAWEKSQMEAREARNKLTEAQQVFKKEYDAGNKIDVSTRQTGNSDLEISQKERIIAEIYNPYMNGDLDNPGVLPGGVFEKYSTNRLKRVLMGALKSYEVSESGDGGCLYDEIDPLTIAYAASSGPEFKQSFRIVADTLTPMAKFKVNGVDVSVYFSFECAGDKCLIDDVTINAPAGELFEEGLYAPSLSKYIENCLKANNIAY